MSSHPARSARAAFVVTFLVAGLCIATGCRRTVESPALGLTDRGEFSVMSYNLRLFAYTDRDRDGQDDDFKPEKEISALTELVCAYRPDIIAVQELGLPSALELLRDRLSACGVDYPYSDYLGSPSSFANLGLLSRFPIVHSEPVTNLSYTIKGETFPVLRGFLQADIQASPDFAFRLIGVHLKSKLFHEAGQTEMRRNEARLLATHVRQLQRRQPDLPILVCGDFNDSYRSAAMRELLDDGASGLSALLLSDVNGDRWTHYYAGEDSYARIDYFLANQSMRERWNAKKSGIVRDERTYQASDHRPIIAVFNAKD